MHNWKRSGHGLGYALAALMVVSCGGGGGGIVDLTGKSENSLAFVTDTSAAVPVPYNGGVVALVLSVKSKTGAGLANQPVSLSITGPGTLLKNSGTTDASGNVTFQIIGGSSEGEGTVTASYVDTEGNQADPLTMRYSVVNPANAISVYSIPAPKILDSNQNEVTGSLLLPTSGNSSATIRIRVTDPSGKTTNQGRLQLSFPAGYETGKGQLSVTSPSFEVERGSDGLPLRDSNNNIIYSAPVVLDAAGQQTGDNRIVVTYTDTLGSKVSTSIPFAIINQYSVLLSADKTALKTGGDVLALKATVVNGASQRVSNLPVSFQIGSGMPLDDAACPQYSSGIGDASQFEPTRSMTVATKGDISLPDGETGKTNSNGVANANYNVVDQKNGSRRIYAVVDAGAGSVKPVACLDVKLSGTIIQLQPEIINTNAGVPFSVTAKVTNGLGNTVPNATVELFGSGVSAAKTVKTAANGSVTVTMSPSAGGGEVTAASPSQATSAVNAEALVQNNISVAVSSKNLAVTVVDGAGTTVGASNPAALNTNYAVKIAALDAGAPISGTVVASTSLGTLTIPSPATLDVNGELTAVLRSNEPGTAYVNVRIIDASGKVSLVSNEAVQFAALVPSKITALAGRTTLDRGESTEIIAKVLDKDDYPVRGQWVQFSVTGDTSGGKFTNGTALAQTNSDGLAIVSYTAGETDTAKDNIVITATLTDPAYASVTGKPVYLTVSGSPVSVSLGTGVEISDLNSTTYAKSYQVMVTNAAGGPVANQEVVLTVVPTYYLKGFYYYNSLAKIWVPKAIDRTTFLAMTFSGTVSGGDTVSEMPPLGCPNEDVNLNGILDAFEDINSDGRLWPGNPVTVSQKVVKTNSSGFATFDVVYAKSYGNWLQVKLIATTRVSGSEALAEREFVLPVSGEDVSDQSVSPPGGLQSPFGQSQATIFYTPDTSVPPVYRPTSASIKTGSNACRLKLNEGGILTVGLP